MELKIYLSRERGRTSRLAKSIGAHVSDMSRWADGSRPIPIPFAPKIEAATDGEVSRKDLFPNDWQEIWPELKE